MRWMNRRACALAVSVTVVFACDGDPSSSPANGEGADGGAPAAPVIECTAPTKGPTKHDAMIRKDETWTADASPHVLTWDVYVASGATLTIEPCAEVLLEEGRVLGTRDGKLVAEGSATRPIHIAGKDGAMWTKLEAGAPGLTRLAYVTIEGGVTMKFPKGKSFQVEHWTNDNPATGALRALGTAERPIVLTSAEASPAPGDWQGLWFGGVPSAQNKLDHVVVEYAGANCGCSMATCSAIGNSDGAVIFANRPASGTEIITSSIIRHIAGHGIVEGWSGDGDTAIDFQPTNKFEDISACVQTRPGRKQGCPNPKPACW